MIVAIVLAAGQATRFGGGKLVAPLDGQPLIRATVAAIARAAIDRMIVVVADDSSGSAVRAALAGLDVTCVANPHAAEGLSTSVRAGIAALVPGTDAVLIALGDQPGVAPEVIDRMIAAWRTHGAAIVAPRYRDGRGNPVLFDARVVPELQLLAGDAGARTLLAREPSRVWLVDVSHDAPRDVDTPDDLRMLHDRR